MLDHGQDESTPTYKGLASLAVMAMEPDSETPRVSSLLLAGSRASLPKLPSDWSSLPVVPLRLRWSQLRMDAPRCRLALGDAAPSECEATAVFGDCNKDLMLSLDLMSSSELEGEFEAEFDGD